jgi:hypothetical protein
MIPRSAAFAFIAWAPFVWSPGRTGLLVEARQDGVLAPFLLQLDTGCDANLLYPGALDPALVHNRELRLNGSIAAYRVTREPFTIYKARFTGINIRLWPSPGPALAGTLGEPFFEHRILILDFPSQRLAILDTLPQTIADRADWTTIQVRNHKIYVPLTINGRTYTDLIFDTGSNLIPLLTTQARWQEWTAGPKTALTVTSWGREVTLTGAPLKMALKLGQARLEHPQAFFDPTTAPTFELIGNPLFANHTVILDLAAHRLGLIAGSLQ